MRVIEMKVIETRGLEFTYPGGLRALKGVDFHLREGERAVLIGHNGAGKTTLTLHFNGILRPTKGEVLFRGEPLRYDRKFLRYIRTKVGIVFQNPDDQIIAPTVKQDVAFGPANLGLPEDEIEKRVRNALRAVGVEKYSEHPPHQLSFGLKKRVAIAGILAMDPEVIIFDEPTANLDPQSSEEFLDLLDELSISGKTLMLVTHDVEIAYEWAERVWVLHEGMVVAHGDPNEIFSNSKLIKTIRMKRPKILEIYRNLRERSFAKPGRIPKNVLELIDSIEIPNLRYIPDGEGLDGRIIHRRDGWAVVETAETRKRGRIVICDSEVMDENDLVKMTDSEDIHYIGAMGTKAKSRLIETGIVPDFTSNVVNNSILKALAGYNCLIMTSGGMIRHAERRIKDYSMSCGIGIPVEIIPSSPDYERAEVKNAGLSYEG